MAPTATSTPARRQVEWDEIICKSGMAKGKRRSQQECKESTLRLDYDEEEREEEELLDTEEVVRQQEQDWLKERGQERGG